MGERSHEKPRAEDLDAADLRVALVASRFNLDITKRLVRGALQALARSGPKNNKGAEAAETAIEMANLIRRLQDRDE